MTPEERARDVVTLFPGLILNPAKVQTSIANAIREAEREAIAASRVSDEAIQRHLEKELEALRPFVGNIARRDCMHLAVSSLTCEPAKVSVWCDPCRARRALAMSDAFEGQKTTEIIE